MTRIVTDTGERNVMTDPKPAARTKASPAEWGRLREEKLLGRGCRVCVALLADELHHLVPRGMGGGWRDDTADNLVGLCRGCHRLIESREPWARTQLGQKLTDAERAYVIGKRGAGWLDKNYGTREAA